MSSAENERLVKEERVANTSQEPDPSSGELHAKKKDGLGAAVMVNDPGSQYPLYSSMGWPAQFPIHRVVKLLTPKVKVLCTPGLVCVTTHMKPSASLLPPPGQRQSIVLQALGSGLQGMCPAQSRLPVSRK